MRVFRLVHPLQSPLFFCLYTCLFGCRDSPTGRPPIERVSSFSAVLILENKILGKRTGFRAPNHCLNESPINFRGPSLSPLWCCTVEREMARETGCVLYVLSFLRWATARCARVTDGAPDWSQETPLSVKRQVGKEDSPFRERERKKKQFELIEILL